MAYIGKNPLVGNYTVLDSLTATTTDTYALTKNSVAVFPQTPANCIVSLNGVIQAPFDSYTISGSNIVFASALTASDSIDFITVLGDVLNVGTVSDGTIGLAKLSATGTKDATTFLRGDNTFQTIGTNTPAFMAQGNTNQTVTIGTATKLTFADENIDTDNAFASNRFTVPSGQGGKYFISAFCRHNTDNGASAQEGIIYMYKNGSQFDDHLMGYYDVTAQIISTGFTAILDLVATDYIEIFFLADSGSNNTVYTNRFFSGFKLIT